MLRELMILCALIAADTTVPPVNIDVVTRTSTYAADLAIQEIAARHWRTVGDLVHPKRGLRFSPYAFIDTQNGVLLTAEEVAALGDDTSVRHWGTYEGTGEPIVLTFQKYFERFVYDRDFWRVKRGMPNERIGRSPTVDNIKKVYRQRDIVYFEYHAPAAADSHEYDWRSLRLVFEKFEGRWFLIAIVHDQWTI